MAQKYFESLRLLIAQKIGVSRSCLMGKNTSRKGATDGAETRPRWRGSEIADRIVITPEGLGYKFYLEDYPFIETTNLWDDTSGRTQDMIYAVQTNAKIIERCVLLSTDPGDLVLDPTCGSGTTAYVAEKWGRRWITCDTSRVAIALAKQRLMTAVFEYL